MERGGVFVDGCFLCKSYRPAAADFPAAPFTDI